MGLNPEVKVVDFVTGDLIKHLPSFTSLPRPDDFIALSEEGGPITTYEVKRVTHVLDTRAVTGATGGVRYNVNGHVEIRVLT